MRYYLHLPIYLKIVRKTFMVKQFNYIIKDTVIYLQCFDYNFENILRTSRARFLLYFLIGNIMDNLRKIKIQHLKKYLIKFMLYF